jgi:methionine synthase II (cobalamin-independent)
MSRPAQLLPSLGTTGIGSLPHSQLELALQLALQVDIPYVPQLPTGHPGEFMIPEALEGLPGLTVDSEGTCTIRLAKWEAEQGAFGARLEAALGAGDTSAFEPSPEACRAWKPFLWEVEHRKLALAKAQLAGPATVRWVAKSDRGVPVSQIPALDQQVLRLVLAKLLARARALRRAGATPLIFIDEPGLYALERNNPRHLVALQELKLLVLALQREGAIVGLHCCSNTEWGLLLDLGLDVLSVDARLSLDALLDEAPALASFLGEGGWLSLGVIPTDVDASYDVQVLVDAVDTSLRAALGSRARTARSQALLTPACGLAMRSPVEAERTFEQVRQAQRGLTALGADPDL